MIDITKLSNRYILRKLNTSDVDDVLRVCEQNTLFYKYTEAQPAKEQILSDMQVAPPGIDHSHKYFIGFFDENNELVAVMDLIDGYPKSEIAYIGLFMMNQQFQGKKIGTAIIDEVTAYLKAVGTTAIRLAIDKGNPQSTHFWKKNGFEIISEADVNGWTKLVAEKILTI